MPVVLWNNSPTILIVAAPLRIKQQKNRQQVWCIFKLYMHQ